ncbi:TPA: hypothetical protein DEB00_02490 [Candidatus Uhrbacteria bacterium]|nr:hypothetical protein [Candidatus Uhrbacteria bacterium]
MIMDTKQFETLLQLASLHVDEDERAGLQQDVVSILSYVDKLQELQLDSVEFVRSVVPVEALRIDEVKPATQEEQTSILHNFPSKTSDGLLEAHAVVDRT